MADTEETFTFQADIKHVLSLIINKFYLSDEIFLRELISNSSDALDKLRFKSNVDSHPDPFIHIVPNKTNNTLSIIDNGIGMTKDDLVNKLATIATPDAGVSIIRKFGIGFYSAYIVAHKVVVVSKNEDDDEQYVWVSQAGESFTIARDTSGEKIGRGTKIILYLKEDQLEYLEERRLKDLVNKYSDFINYPISIWTEKEVSDDERKRVGWDIVNKQKPIWMRKPEEVTKEEYASYYKSLTNDGEGYLAVKHFSVQGFTTLLFVPEKAPIHLFDTNIKLYARSVFIMDNCQELIPEYLSFVKGIVDSESLPLHISREMLQPNKISKGVRQNLVNICLELFFQIAEHKEDYTKFYSAFSNNLKLGILRDSHNRTKLAEFLRYYSSKSGDEMTRFKDYVTRMKEGQNEIYYITGESKKAVDNSTLLDKLKKQGYEVMYMVDAIDEYVIGQLQEFEGNKLVSAIKEVLKLDQREVEKKKHEALTEKFEVLCNLIKEILGDEVDEVVVSERVVNSPCCLVTGEFGGTADIERIMKPHALGDSSSKKTMEINPENSIMEHLRKRVADSPKVESIKGVVSLLFGTALLTSGFSLEEPNAFCNQIHMMLKMGLDIHDDGSETEADEDMPPLEDADAETLREPLANVQEGLKCKTDEILEIMKRLSLLEAIVNGVKSGNQNEGLTRKVETLGTMMFDSVNPMLRRLQTKTNDLEVKVKNLEDKQNVDETLDNLKEEIGVRERLGKVVSTFENRLPVMIGILGALFTITFPCKLKKVLAWLIAFSCACLFVMGALVCFHFGEARKDIEVLTTIHKKLNSTRKTGDASEGVDLEKGETFQFGTFWSYAWPHMVDALVLVLIAVAFVACVGIYVYYEKCVPSLALWTGSDDQLNSS